MMKETHRKNSQKKYRITVDKISLFETQLHTEERSAETTTKYMHSVEAFMTGLGDQNVTKDKVGEWKELHREPRNSAVTINGMLAALNSFFAILRRYVCRVEYLKIQR